MLYCGISVSGQLNTAVVLNEAGKTCHKKAFDFLPGQEGVQQLQDFFAGLQAVSENLSIGIVYTPGATDAANRLAADYAEKSYEGAFVLYARLNSCGYEARLIDFFEGGAYSDFSGCSMLSGYRALTAAAFTREHYEQPELFFGSRWERRYKYQRWKFLLALGGAVAVACAHYFLAESRQPPVTFLLEAVVFCFSIMALTKGMVNLLRAVCGNTELLVLHDDKLELPGINASTYIYWGDIEAVYEITYLYWAGLIISAAGNKRHNILLDYTKADRKETKRLIRFCIAFSAWRKNHGVGL